MEIMFKLNGLVVIEINPINLPDNILKEEKMFLKQSDYLVIEFNKETDDFYGHIYDCPLQDYQYQTLVFWNKYEQDD